MFGSDCVNDINQIKEDLSISYIIAVASRAGVDYEIIRHDGDSTDGILKTWILRSDGI